MIAGVHIPANWEALPRNNANKDELLCYLSECIQACETGRKVIISTKDETIVSTQNDMNDVEYLQPCPHEEVDTRLINSELTLASVLTFDRLLSTRLLKMPMKKQ